MIRALAAIAIASLVVAACGSSKPPPEPPAPTYPSDISIPATPTPTPTLTAADDSCFLQQLRDGTPIADIQSRCDLDALVDEIAAAVRLRQGVANAFNSIRFNFDMTAADVVGWEQAVCEGGAARIQELIERVSPTPKQAITLLSPLLDFAFDAARSCPSQPGLRDALTAQAWHTALGPPSLTQTPSDVLLGQTTAPDYMTDLFKEAHSVCDVVGNAAVLGVQSWGQVKLPDFVSLALSTFVGFECGKVLE